MTESDPPLWYVAWPIVLFMVALGACLTFAFTNNNPEAWGALSIAVGVVAVQPLCRKRLYRRYPKWAPPRGRDRGEAR